MPEDTEKLSCLQMYICRAVPCSILFILYILLLLRMFLIFVVFRIQTLFVGKVLSHWIEQLFFLMNIHLFMFYLSLFNVQLNFNWHMHEYTDIIHLEKNVDFHTLENCCSFLMNLSAFSRIINDKPNRNVDCWSLIFVNIYKK